MTLQTATPVQPVLLIEDNPLQSDVMTRWLASAGQFDVHIASDGLQAASLLKKQPWTLVVSDIDLPGRTGLELLRDFRELDADTPFLVVSGVASAEHACSALRERASDLLLKPIDGSTFVSTVTRLVDASSRTVPDSAHITARRAHFRHAQFLSSSHNLVDQLTSPLTRLTIAADLLLLETAGGRLPNREEMVKHRSTMDQAVHQASCVLRDLKSLLQIGSTGLQQTDLVSHARAAMLLASTTLAARGIRSTFTPDRSSLYVLGSADAVRTVLGSTLLGLAENSAGLHMTSVDLSVGEEQGPVARITLQRDGTTPHPSLLDSLGSYIEVLMLPLGGSVYVRTTRKGTTFTLAFQPA